MFHSYQKAHFKNIKMSRRLGGKFGQERKGVELQTDVGEADNPQWWHLKGGQHKIVNLLTAEQKH